MNITKEFGRNVNVFDVLYSSDKNEEGRTDSDQDKMVSLAINNHDALVEALEFCVSEMKNYDFMCDETKCDTVIKLGDIEDLLTKAKGES